MEKEGKGDERKRAKIDSKYRTMFDVLDKSSETNRRNEGEGEK